MKMTKADQSKYPKVRFYVENNLPEIVNVPVIVKAMEKIGEINLKQLEDALVWGSGPSITFVDNMTNCGEFIPNAGSQELRINSRLASEFENGDGKKPTADGKEVYILGVTLLHELIHWGDDQNGVDRPDEEGEEFETAVYGKVIPC